MMPWQPASHVDVVVQRVALASYQALAARRTPSAVAAPLSGSTAERRRAARQKARFMTPDEKCGSRPGRICAALSIERPSLDGVHMSRKDRPGLTKRSAPRRNDAALASKKNSVVTPAISENDS